MDSLDMNNLARSLPSSSIVKADQETMDKFKAAAQSLTLLYRSSQRASKRHFDAGYAMALDDLTSVIQHGVSAELDLSPPESGGTEVISIGRILDWIEARQESLRLKAREEEEEEEEKETKMRHGGTSRSSIGPAKVSDKVGTKSGENASTLPTLSTRSLASGISARSSAGPPGTMLHDDLDSPSSPVLPPAPSSHVLAVQPPLPPRPLTRARLRSKHVLAPLNPTTMNTSNPTSNTGSSSDPSMASVIGAKRRRAAMLLDHCTPSTVSVALHPSDLRNNSSPSPALVAYSSPHPDGIAFPGTSTPTYLPNQRRRVRNSRLGAFPQSENVGVNDIHGVVGVDVAMDAEEDSGRERKRTTRR